MVKKVLSWTLFVLLVAGWFVWFRPVALGGGTSLLVVAGSSMEPTLMPGDLMLTRSVDAYEVGDVVVYTIPDGQPGAGTDAMIVHRLTDGDATSGFTTQGDNLPKADPWTPTPEDIVGSLWLHLPRGGHALLWVLQPAVVGGLAGMVTVYLVMGGNQRRRPAPSAPTDDGDAVLDDAPTRDRVGVS